GEQRTRRDAGKPPEIPRSPAPQPGPLPASPTSSAQDRAAPRLRRGDRSGPWQADRAAAGTRGERASAGTTTISFAPAFANSSREQRPDCHLDRAQELARDDQLVGRDEVVVQVTVLLERRHAPAHG